MNKELAEMIRSKRIKMNMTQAELAKKADAGNGPVFISAIENCKSKAPLKILKRICDVLSLPEDRVISSLVKEYKLKVSKELGVK